MRAACSLWSPWEKFSLNVVAPAFTSSLIRSGLSVAGPMVATILVRRFRSNWPISRLKIPAETTIRAFPKRPHGDEFLSERRPKDGCLPGCWP